MHGFKTLIIRRGLALCGLAAAEAGAAIPEDARTEYAADCREDNDASREQRIRHEHSGGLAIR